jgi:hypothetical protein
MAKAIKAQEAERAEAITKLRDWLKPGDTVHTILDHVSTSGMSRDIRIVILSCAGDRAFALHPNHSVRVALGLPKAKRGDGMRVGGAGMDMGFHLVYTLGRVLFPEGTATRADGGYALRHEWL